MFKSNHKLAVKIILWVFAVLFLVFLGINVFFKSDVGRQIISKKIISELNYTLKTKVYGTVSYNFFDWIKLNDFLIKDIRNDTLLYAKSCDIDIDMLALLHNNIAINKIDIHDGYLNVNNQKRVFNYQPILDSLSKASSAKGKPFETNLKTIWLHNFKFNYHDVAKAEKLSLFIKKARTGFDKLNVAKSQYFLKNIDLNDIQIVGNIATSSGNNNNITKTKSVLPDVKFAGLVINNFNCDLHFPTNQKKLIVSQLNLKLDPKTINLPQNIAIFNSFGLSAQKINYGSQKNSELIKGQMNFDNMFFNQSSLLCSNIIFQNDSLNLIIQNLQTNERSGLKIQKTHALLSQFQSKINLRNTQIETNRSSLQFDTHYFSEPNLVYDLNLIQSNIDPKDLLYFNKNLLKNPYFANLVNDKIKAKANLKGNSNSTNFENLSLWLPKNSQLALKGSVKNFNRPLVDLKILKLNSTKADILQLLPKNSLPKNISLPQNITMTGSVSGVLDNINTKLSLGSTYGNANLEANVIQKNGLINYLAKIKTYSFALGLLLTNPKLGKVSSDFNLVGSSEKNAKFKIDGIVNSVVYDSKNYQKIAVNGILTNNIFNTKVKINDPAINAEWEGVLDLKAKDLSLGGKTKLQNVNLKSLGLSTDNLNLKGDFDILSFTANAVNPLINLTGQNVQIQKDGKDYAIGNLKIITTSTKKENQLQLISDFLKLNLNGNVPLPQIYNVVLGEVNNYFKVPNFNVKTLNTNASFDLSGTLLYHPILKLFDNKIQGFEPITFKSALNNANSQPFNGLVDIPYLKYDFININNSQINFKGNHHELDYNVVSNEILKDKLKFKNTTVDGIIKDNVAAFNVSLKDSVDTKIHGFSGFVQNIDNTLRVSFDESNSMLFYESWAGNPYGYIEYNEKGVKFNEVVFTSGKQIIRVNSLDAMPNGPLQVFTKNINLSKMVKAFTQDSTMVAGSMDADLVLKNYMDKAPSFVGDFQIGNFHLNKVNLGQFDGNAESLPNNGIKLASTVKGQNSDMNINGTYFPDQKEALDLNIDLNKVDNQLIETYGVDIIRNITGEFTGNFNMKGSLNEPDIQGKGFFKDFNFYLVQTGGKISIQNQNFELINKKALFSDFIVQDENQNKLKVNGFLNIAQLPNFDYRFNLDTKKFKFIDAKKGDNTLFMGQGFFDSELLLVGRNSDFKLTGDVKIDEKTDLTLLLADEAEQSSEMPTIVDFVSFDKGHIMQRKSQNKQKTAKINFANSVNINVEVVNEATLKILMDAVTGDLMTVNGNGKLATGFDNKGDLFILGKYDIVGGKYNLTYQVIKKQFSITPSSNSSIVWSGDPMQGKLDITAEYNAGKKIIGKFPFTDTTSTSYQGDKLNKLNIPVRIDLMVSGMLTKPLVNFEMVLNKSETGTESQFLQDQGFSLLDNYGKKENYNNTVNNAIEENIKSQAIILLVSNSFGGISDIVKNSSDLGNMEKVAREKVADLINSQLSRYTQGIIKGIDVNLGLQSGINTANDARNTNLNLGFSKKFANDRLIIKVGKNFELENKDMRSDEIVDNVQANWFITKDGRYRINVFRKSNNQGIVEGTVIETGLGFALALDYDVFQDLKKKK